jgi:hypothetical protein
VSGYTQTTNEVLYSFAGASTNLATFTAEDNLLKTYPLCQIPGSYFGQGMVGGLSKTLKIKAGGQMGFTTGAPTFLWSIRAIASTTWSATTVLLGATAALATGAVAVVTTPWFLEFDLTLRTAAAAAGTATVVGMGEVRAPAALASPFDGTIPSLAVSPAITTWDINAVYYLFLSCACGTSNSLNLINTQYMKVYGEN